MLVLHGFWAARDGLCLWAEDSELAVEPVWKFYPKSLLSGNFTGGAA